MAIAIIGMSPSCEDAPWYNDQWEMWGIARHDEYWARCDRLFEIHEQHEKFKTIDVATQKAKDISVPLYAFEAYNDYVTPYPYDKIDNYLQSTISHMLALAIHENPPKIGIWGVDMTDHYGYQRPNTEYLIGYARGKGIEVLIHETSPLCKQKTRYGTKEFRIEPWQ